ncbi:MAG TPA: NAD(P)H-dependent glycerol-3-phosphate dehydrogenase [Acetobacteraceae bacterium]|nr:NAD(P)H-dependent glycerol-3-phosphate dehydrogenase [Acetobacteraceae bacterium]
MNRVAILGAGAWGTALAVQATRAGAAVTLWARDPAPIAGTRENPRLPGIRLPDSVAVTGTLPGAGQDALLLTIPLAALRGLLDRIAPAGPLVVCAKGVEQGSLRLPLEIVAARHPGVACAVLTGPNFAREVALGLPTASVIAAADAGLRQRLIGLLGTPGFRLYGNDDPMGAQVGGAAKNVVAIAAGAVIGAGLGENARAALVTRGLAEIGRLAVALGGRAETVAGLSGLGDLLLSCAGPTSRNYALGLALGRGESLDSALAAGRGVVEGVATAPALVARAGDLDLPICRAVAALVSGRLTLGEAVAALLARPLRDE